MNSSLFSDLHGALRRLFTSRRRIAALLAFGPRGLGAILHFLTRIVPDASRELAMIRKRAQTIPDPDLRREALASIDRKAYHVQGGAILATFLPAPEAARHIAIIAPLETIYDYLDNICDRLDGVPVEAYGVLHEALCDAVDPDRTPSDYYRAGPRADDGGYLRWLVTSVQEQLRALPHLALIRTQLAQAARLYSELQTFKHFPESQRDTLCAVWYERNAAAFPELKWWEFAAACGSSLPVFALLFLAAHPTISERDVDGTFGAYLPKISAVHIMLDYFIDQAEDREHHELNFVACYRDSHEALERLAWLIERAQAALRDVPYGDCHRFLLRAMALFYLSHPKVFEQRLQREGAFLLAALTTRQRGPHAARRHNR